MGSRAKRLKKARRIRHLIASEFRALEKGTLSARDALENPSPVLKRVRVYDILMRVPGIGEESAKKILHGGQLNPIWPMERLGALSREQRHEIIAALPPRSKPS